MRNGRLETWAIRLWCSLAIVGFVWAATVGTEGSSAYDAGKQLGNLAVPWVIVLVVLILIRRRATPAAASPTTAEAASQPAPPTAGTCPQCGQIVDTRMTSCPRCGFVPGPAATTATPASSEPPST
jgi:hypothetical protein